MNADLVTARKRSDVPEHEEDGEHAENCEQNEKADLGLFTHKRFRRGR
jgi:hypothetical protein